MKRTMFERYGGFAVVHKVVLAFYDRVLDSDVLAGYFDGVDMRRLVDHQTKFISQVMGGPVTYTNEVLQQLHATLQITDAAFDEMIRLMGETLEDFDFEADDVAAVVADLRSRKPFIVGVGNT
jgi:hemoglobin